MISYYYFGKFKYGKKNLLWFKLKLNKQNKFSKSTISILLKKEMQNVVV